MIGECRGIEERDRGVLGMMNFKPTEKEIAKIVIAWLKNQHWVIYQEVQQYMYGPVADIVAVQGKILWVIETKTSLTFKLIAQVQRWKMNAHYVSVAVPSAKLDSGRLFAEHVLKWQGIGLFTVAGNEVGERIAPKLNRYAYKSRLIKKLKPEQQYWAEAGNANSERWTPFAETCRNIVRIVQRSPGITAKELIDGTRTHYSTPASARTCIIKWAREGIIRGIRIDESRPLRFWPDKME